jgi:hypothetical protein
MWIVLVFKIIYAVLALCFASFMYSILRNEDDLSRWNLWLGIIFYSSTWPMTIAGFLFFLTLVRLHERRHGTQWTFG